MSYYDYAVSRNLAGQDVPFYALIMTAIRQADTANLRKLRDAFPQTYDEFEARYHAPGGLLPGERVLGQHSATEGGQQ